MKIFSIEVATDAGRRVVSLQVPLVVELQPESEMPVQFRALTDALWGLVREIAVQAPEAPKVEA